MSCVLRNTSLAMFALLPCFAFAVPISPQLSITGEVSVDTSAAGLSSDYNGSLYSNSESTSFTAALISGNNPVTTGITETGQGLGHTLFMDATEISGNFIAIDYFFSLTNNSADDYSLSFGVDFENVVDADGPDAFADSEFSVIGTDASGVFDPLLGELFFSDVISDTFFGDQQAGSALATAGGLIQETGTDFFALTLGAGSSLYFSATLLADAGVFADDSGYLLQMDSFIYLSEATNLTDPTDPPTTVPEPGSLALMLAGLTLLYRRTQTTKRT